MTVEEMMTISNGISVVVPAYNAEKSIERAIRSALQCKEVERIIVVDDGSVDNTAGVATAVDPKVEVISQPNSGAFVARQRGVEAAQSEFLVLLDADDQLLANGVSASLQMAVSDEALGSIVGRYANISPMGAIAAARRAHGHIDAISLIRLGYSPGPPAAMLWRRTTLLEALATEPAPLIPRFADDYELIIRAALVSCIGSHNEFSCLYALGDGKSFENAEQASVAGHTIQMYYAKHLGVALKPWSARRTRSAHYFRRARVARSRRSIFVWLVNSAVGIALDPVVLIRLVFMRCAIAFKQDVIFQDWAVNRGDLRIQLALVFFRVASKLREPRAVPPRIGAIPVGMAYRAIVQWILGIDLPWRAQVGQRLRVFHGYGLVVSDEAVIGNDVILRHGVTIGHRRPGGGSPVIGDGVEFGAGAIVLGPVHIGEGASVAAGSVVVDDVEPRGRYRGFPNSWYDGLQ